MLTGILNFPPYETLSIMAQLPGKNIYSGVNLPKIHQIQRRLGSPGSLVT
jgi:hypothetical protein